MTWIERTAYPRLPRAVSLKELRESFTPRDQLVYLGQLCGRRDRDVARSMDSWLERLGLARAVMHAGQDRLGAVKVLRFRRCASQPRLGLARARFETRPPAGSVS